MAAPKDGHPPSFQFYPRDFLSDPAVAVMSLKEVGAYIRLLCYAWLSEEPGVLPDDNAVLGALCGTPSEWSALRPALARAFRVQNGHWMQRRMVCERLAQKNRYEQAKRGADLTNAKRKARHDVDSLCDTHSAPLSATDSARSAVAPASASASASASESLNLLQTPCPADAGRSAWAARFGEFWKGYPRRENKARALAKWRSLALSNGHADALFTAIMSGLERAKASEQWKRGIIPHASAWLNGSRWEDEVHHRRTGSDSIMDWARQRDAEDAAARREHDSD